jgi:ClpP class serine protease
MFRKILVVSVGLVAMSGAYLPSAHFLADGVRFFC